MKTRSKIFLGIAGITSVLAVSPVVVSCGYLQIPEIHDARFIQKDDKTAQVVIVGKGLELIKKFINELEIVEKGTETAITGWQLVPFPTGGFPDFPEATNENSMVIELDENIQNIDLTKDYQIRIKKFPLIKFDIPKFEVPALLK